MLRKCEIIEGGESNYLKGEIIERAHVIDECAKLEAEGKEPAIFEPILLGITKGSLVTESFISAASFQETTRVLTEASVRGGSDPLNGPKEAEYRKRNHHNLTGFHLCSNKGEYFNYT
jgi:DNA-directed RNA polymerase subunit beta'